MLSFPSPSPKHQSKDKGEWTVLTYDVDRPCVICLHYLHRGQAVGYIDGTLVHAKCHQRNEETTGRRGSAA